MHSGIQDLLVPLGLAPTEAERMTASVVRLAGDLGSFNNVPVAEALADIRSGLVGSERAAAQVRRGHRHRDGQGNGRWS